MAQSSNPRSDNPGAIIGREFCDRESLRLTRNNGDFTATCVNSKVKHKFTLEGPQLKADGKPLLTLERNTARTKRWEVFGGTKAKDLRFSVKKSKTQLDVILAANENENMCDFNIKGKWGDQSCKIYRGGDSSIIIAQMDKDKIMRLHPNKDYPNVDCAFIVALVWVLEVINS